jgi:hypothetical protein
VNLDPEGSHLELNFTLGDKRGPRLEVEAPMHIPWALV